MMVFPFINSATGSPIGFFNIIFFCEKNPKLLIRRASWPKECFMRFHDNGFRYTFPEIKRDDNRFYCLDIRDFRATDWEGLEVEEEYWK